MDGSLQDKVQALLDKDAIRDVLYRYAEAIDRWDRDALAAVFMPDAVLNVGVYNGPASGMLGEKRSDTLIATHHAVGNIRIKLDGDRARSIAYVNAIHFSRHGDQLYHEMFRSRYLDRFVRYQGQWRIGERALVRDWHFKAPASSDDVKTNLEQRSARDQADQILGFLD